MIATIKKLSFTSRQYIVTIRRMTLNQISSRLRRLVLEHLWQKGNTVFAPPVNHSIKVPGWPQFGYIPSEQHIPKILENADAIVGGRFCFLNQTMDFPDGKPLWNATPDTDPLWTYNLHYFEYAYDLLWAHQSTGRNSYLQCLLALMDDWIDKNPFWTRIAWNPYPLSKRIIVWTVIVSHLNRGSAMAEEMSSKIVSSLCQQASFLFANLEYDIDNNHLITNARALVWAGVYLSGHQEADQWLQKGLSLLTQEADKQILDDGGHCERSSSYHMVVLQDFLETLLLLECAGIVQPQSLRRAVGRMIDFARDLVGPHGRIPLVNDAIEKYPEPVANLLAAGAILLSRPELKGLMREEPDEYIEWLFEPMKVSQYRAWPVPEIKLSSVALPQSGYFVMRSGQAQNARRLLFDCGPIGPAHSTAHAHADTLSFELSAFGEVLLIDPGVYEYKAGKWRDYFRSTAVHNTVTVDEQDQSVFWGAFRVAEMAQAQLLCWESNEAYDFVEGQHDGYTRLNSPVIHNRAIRYTKPNRWVITDTLTSDGRANHLYQLHFHLAPSAQPEHITVSSSRITFPNGIALFIETEHPSTTSVELCDAWISYTWKQKQASKILRYSLQTSAVLTRFKTTLRICEAASIY
jgi:uncharacterized heparinase superfamily protein